MRRTFAFPLLATMTLACGSERLIPVRNQAEGSCVPSVVCDPLVVEVPAALPSADIVLAIDTTGSMLDSIAQARAEAIALVDGIQAIIRDAAFAVVDFRDVFDGPNEYLVRQPMTTSAMAVHDAIGAMTAVGGGDEPEAYNLVFHNSYSPAVGGEIGWRNGTRKLVVVIGDAPPHDARGAGITECPLTDSRDPHGFNTALELAGMAAAERTLLMVLSGGSEHLLPCYQALARRAFSGGQAVVAGSDLSGQIVGLVRAAFALVNEVHLEVVAATPPPANASWVSFTPPALERVTAPADYDFTEIIHVPHDAPAGTYSFDVVAKADGVDFGHQRFDVIVVEDRSAPPSRSTSDEHSCHNVGAIREQSACQIGSQLPGPR
jgi:hypothetical protein